MHWNNSEAIAPNLRRVLAKRWQEYLDTGQDAFSTKRSWTELHEFRIQTKRIRYTLELFEDYYGPAYEGLLERLRKMQNHLGDVNDLIAARQLLKKAAGTDEIREQLKGRAERKLAQTRTYWRKEFSDEAAARWTRYLRTQARPKPIPQE